MITIRSVSNKGLSVKESVTGKRQSAVKIREISMNNFRIKRDLVAPFIEKLRSLAWSNQYDLVPRVKNLISLKRHKLHYAEIRDILLSLAPEDLYKEPTKDLKPGAGGAFWIFKKDVGSTLFYIKLKIDQDQIHNSFIKLMSFHEDERRQGRRIALV